MILNPSFNFSMTVMKKLYILPLVAAAMLSTACSSEHPFDFDGDGNGEGQILKSALAVSIEADELVRQNAPTRAADANIDDFNVIFYKAGSTVPVASYRYGDMPEVISLPAGSYSCTATYGENRIAEWESPYFLGASETFDVTAYEITSYIEPIVCHLENVKVSIDFDSALRAKMSPDSYVEVKVGSSSSLNFGIAEADAQKAGYFMHTDEVSLVAVFYGTVDGSKVVETKSLDNIRKGYHYKIKFKLHIGSGDSSTGDADANVNVDADVNVIDVTRNVSLGEDPLLDDNERPTEGGGDDPSPDPNPAPTIEADAPVNLDAVNDGDSLSSCVLHIKSSDEGGFTQLVCDIESNSLTPEELAGVGLSSHLDLVNTPADMADPLANLGFPVNVGGQNDVTFNLTPFLTLLKALGPDEHHFILTVGDANGTTVKTLKIKFN